MRNLTITLALAASIFAVTSDAKAADWNNNQFSCNIEVKDTYFGKWTGFYAKFYLTATPEAFLNIKCYLTGSFIVIPSSMYKCYIDDFDTVTTAPWDWSAIKSTTLTELAPGITQRQTCETLFNKINPAIQVQKSKN